MAAGHVEWPNGRASFLIDFGYRPDGTRDRQRYSPKRLGVPEPQSEKAAAVALRKILGRIDEGTWVRPSPVTYGEWLTEWISRREGSTRDTYESLARNHILPRIGEARLQALCPLDVRRLYAALADAGLSPATVQLARSIVAGSYAEAEELRLVAHSPARGISVPEPDREVVALDRDEARALLERARARGWRYYPALALTLWTGLRISETRGLRWSDVDLEARALHVRWQIGRSGTRPTFRPPKTKASVGTVPLIPSALALLRSQRRAQAEERLAAGPAYHPNNLVVCTPLGAALPEGDLYSEFAALMEESGRPGFPWQGLRHTYATLALADGTEVHVVSRWLRHKDVATTLEYYAAYLPSSRDAGVARLERSIGHRLGTVPPSEGEA
jgi:integrase